MITFGDEKPLPFVYLREKSARAWNRPDSDLIKDRFFADLFVKYWDDRELKKIKLTWDREELAYYIQTQLRRWYNHYTQLRYIQQRLASTDPNDWIESHSILVDHAVIDVSTYFTSTLDDWDLRIELRSCLEDEFELTCILLEFWIRCTNLTFENVWRHPALDLYKDGSFSWNKPKFPFKN